MTMLHLAATNDNDPTPIPSIQSSEDLFQDFWVLWMRHEAKKDARKAWNQLTPEQQVRAVIAAASWRDLWLSRGTDPQYIKLPATWLRGECFDDELPMAHGQRSAAHAPAKLPEAVVRGEIPDKVRAQIARLKGQR